MTTKAGRREQPVEGHPLAREAAALAQIASSVVSADSLEATLNALAASVVEATRAVACSVVLFDAETDTFRVAGCFGLPDGYTEAMVAASRAGAQSLAARAGESGTSSKSERALLVPRARQELLASPLHAPLHGFLRDAAWEPVVVVPLIYRGRRLGAVNVYYLPTANPGLDAIALLTAIADLAAVAVENAQLYAQAQQAAALEERVAERTHELLTLLEVSHNVASTLELEPLLDLILEQLGQVVEYAGSSILTLDGEELVILGAGGDNVVTGDARGLRFQVGHARPIWDRISRREAVIISDIRGEEELALAYRTVVGELLGRPPFSLVRSWLGVPLALKDRLIGMLTVSRREPGAFTAHHANLVMAMASQAAVAIENARLYQQAQSLAALQERQRLARELHDSVSQALYGIALGTRTARTLLDRDPARVAEPLDYVLSLAEAGLAEMRALIFELRPESLETEGLVAALTKQADALRARHRIVVVADLGEEPDAPLRVKEALYRIGQEALHNTVKHARASEVGLRLGREGGSLVLVVQDDGRGFDPGGEFPGHLGLRSMRERAAAFGGGVEIESAPVGGTRVRATIPVAG